jgi:5-methylcytosine-specific restriction protein A
MPTRAPTHTPGRALPLPEAQHVTPGTERLSPSRRGYDRVWTRARRMFLRRHPMCEAPGCNRPAEDVHHVIPLQKCNNRLDFANLQALCHSCHSRVTGEERAKNTQKEAKT